MLEPEIIVEMAGQMFLDAEKARLLRALSDLAGWLRRLTEIAFLPVLFERHGDRYAVSRASRFSGTEKTRKNKPAPTVNAVTAVNRLGNVMDS